MHPCSFVFCFLLHYVAGILFQFFSFVVKQFVAIKVLSLLESLKAVWSLWISCSILTTNSSIPDVLLIFTIGLEKTIHQFCRQTIQCKATSLYRRVNAKGFLIQWHLEPFCFHSAICWLIMNKDGFAFTRQYAS